MLKKILLFVGVMVVLSVVACGIEPGDPFEDKTSPSVSVSPTGSITTNEAFTVSLTANDNYGYYSTNGVDFVQFSKDETVSLLIYTDCSLQYYGDDGKNKSTPKFNTYTFEYGKVFVSTYGDDANDGKTPAKAVLTVQQAIYLADYYNYTDVYVETGLYTPGAGLANYTNTNQYAGIFIDNIDNINLVGGWNHSFTAWEDYSILDGANGTNSTNKHIFWVQGGTTNLTINGFVIRNGDATGTSGGGIYFHSTMHSLITNCIISNNIADNGGGIYFHGNGNYGCQYNTISASISDNIAIQNGGGIYFYGEGQMSCKYIVISGVVYNNIATQNGGGIYFYGASSSCNNNTISATIFDNIATQNGGGIYFYGAYSSCNNNTISGAVYDNNAGIDGGGIYFYGFYVSCNNNIISATISDNIATQNGGGIYFYGGTTGNGQHSCENNIISGSVSGNSATDGGGIYFYGNNTGIVSYSCNDNIITAGISNNNATQNGGGIYFYGNNFRAGNSTYSCCDNTISGVVSGNNAAQNGGGFYFYGNFADSCDDNVISATISGNSANDGGGIYFSGYSSANVVSGFLMSNTARFYGAGVYMGGADNNTFTGTNSYNQAGWQGGGFCLYDSCTGNAIGGLVSFNTAYDGAGAYFYKSGANTVSALMYDNIAQRYGGGISFYDVCDGNTVSGHISRNTATNTGGGVYLYNSDNNTFNASCVINYNWAVDSLYGGGVFDANNCSGNTHGSADVSQNLPDNWYDQP